MSVTTDVYASSGSITTTNAGDYPYYEVATPLCPSSWETYYPPPYNTGEQFDEAIKRLENKINNKMKGDDDMRYLYEVILVNPKNDIFHETKVVAKSETSALMSAYNKSEFAKKAPGADFDDLKTSCRILMEWKKEKSLEKALETIKKAVE